MLDIDEKSLKESIWADVWADIRWRRVSWEFLRWCSSLKSKDDERPFVRPLLYSADSEKPSRNGRTLFDVFSPRICVSWSFHFGSLRLRSFCLFRFLWTINSNWYRTTAYHRSTVGWRAIWMEEKSGKKRKNTLRRRTWASRANLPRVSLRYPSSIRRSKNSVENWFDTLKNRRKIEPKLSLSSSFTGEVIGQLSRNLPIVRRLTVRWGGGERGEFFQSTSTKLSKRTSEIEKRFSSVRSVLLRPATKAKLLPRIP